MQQPDTGFALAQNILKSGNFEGEIVRKKANSKTVIAAHKGKEALINRIQSNSNMPPNRIGSSYGLKSKIRSRGDSKEVKQ